MHAAAIPSARFTDVPVPPKGPVSSPGTMQVFTIRILTGDTSCLKLPLQVYGVVAARDVVDYKRNIIFERARDDCQIITEEVCVFCSLSTLQLICTSTSYTGIVLI